MASIRKSKKEKIANQINCDAIREIAQMQREIDEYQRLIGDIMLWLLYPGNVSIKSDLPQAGLIWEKINKLQNEIKELKEKAP